MVDAVVIEGAAIAADMNAKTARVAQDFEKATGRKPCLAVVLVGANPASQVYVKNKIRTAERIGIISLEHRLEDTRPQRDLIDLISKLNEDPSVDGILVQLPLPSHIEAQAVIASISPQKDVDGFNPINAGLLALGQSGFVPCTPLGCLHLIKTIEDNIAGMHAVVLGRSNIVGKPMAQLLLQADCTVTVAHSKTCNLTALLATADLVIAAMGRPEFVQGAWLKAGAIVIDVGINRVSSGEQQTKLVGDVHFESAKAVARAITPVPGGVGPMTIAYLMKNTCRAASLNAGYTA